MTRFDKLKKTRDLFALTVALHTAIANHLDGLKEDDMNNHFLYFVEKAKDEVKDATEYLWNELGRASDYDLGTFVEAVQELINPHTNE